MLAIAFLALYQSPPTIEAINKFVMNKDVKALAPFSTGDGSEFKVLKGGAYEVGKFGWKALALEPKFSNRKFIVLTTPLTSEDTGELLFERVGAKLKYIPEDQPENLLLKHHKLSINFRPADKEARIMDEVSAETTSLEGLDVHSFRFSPCYRVSSVTDGTKDVPWIQVGGILMIPKQKPGSVRLSISYVGTVNLPKYAGSISVNNATLTNDYWYPMINRMPTTFELNVEHPADWEVVAQGNKISDEPSRGGVVTTYKMDLPAIYWSLTAGKIKHYQEQVGGLTQHVWTTNMSNEKMKLMPRINAHILATYSNFFGPYPFKQWGSLDSPTYGGGALEAYSFATYGEGWLPAIDAHEPAHTWFGGILPNTYLHSFWNEGFAVWSEGFYERECDLGSNEDRRQAFVKVPTASEEYNVAPLTQSGVFIGAAASTLGYGKSGDVLAMLEQLVGTFNMTQGIKEWVKTHPKGQPAEWEEFERIMLKRLPQYELKSFFDDWFRRPGFANVALSGCVFQKGKFTGKLNWKGPKFRMPLELWFENVRGARQSVTLDTRKVAEDGTFSIDLVGFAPSKVYLDPLHRALRFGPQPNFKSFGDEVKSLKTYRDPNHGEYLKSYDSVAKDLKEIDGKFIIGHPDTTLEMKELCVKAGFSVVGNNLTFRGTTIDLTKSAAFAFIELDGDKKCAIGLGKCEIEPSLGQAHTGLTDDLGRMLRGSTRFPINAISVGL